MRQQIVDAARRLFVTEGYDQVTVRKIADAIEYTPGAIYSYFDDKDAIFHALHTEGFSELMRRMAAATIEVAASNGSPLDQLRRIGAEYLAFARDNPEMYDLMFVAQAPVRDELQDWPEGTRAFDVLRSVVRAAVEGGWIHVGEPEAIAFMLWSACHGMVSLEFRGRCKVLEETLRPGLSGTVLDYLITSMSTQASDDRPAVPDRPVGKRRSRPES